MNNSVLSVPPPFYRAEAKWKRELSLQESQCIALCQKGVYHHNQLKQTYIGKCNK